MISGRGGDTLRRALSAADTVRRCRPTRVVEAATEVGLMVEDEDEEQDSLLASGSERQQARHTRAAGPCLVLIAIVGAALWASLASRSGASHLEADFGWLAAADGQSAVRSAGSGADAHPSLPVQRSPPSVARHAAGAPEGSRAHCVLVLDLHACECFAAQPATIQRTDQARRASRDAAGQAPRACLASCHGRGVCNHQTGQCNCEAGRNGTTCESLNPRPCNGPHDGLWVASHCAGECDHATGFCWCPGKLGLRPMGESCQPRYMPLQVRPQRRQTATAALPPCPLPLTLTGANPVPFPLGAQPLPLPRRSHPSSPFSSALTLFKDEVAVPCPTPPLPAPPPPCSAHPFTPSPSPSTCPPFPAHPSIPQAFAALGLPPDLHHPALRPNGTQARLGMEGREGHAARVQAGQLLATLRASLVADPHTRATLIRSFWFGSAESAAAAGGGAGSSRGHVPGGRAAAGAALAVHISGDGEAGLPQAVPLPAATRGAEQVSTTIRA